jgi:hypothetical protein
MIDVCSRYSPSPGTGWRGFGRPWPLGKKTRPQGRRNSTKRGEGSRWDSTAVATRRRGPRQPTRAGEVQRTEPAGGSSRLNSLRIRSRWDSTAVATRRRGPRQPTRAGEVQRTEPAGGSSRLNSLRIRSRWDSNPQALSGAGFRDRCNTNYATAPTTCSVSGRPDDRHATSGVATLLRRLPERLLRLASSRLSSNLRSCRTTPSHGAAPHRGTAESGPNLPLPLSTYIGAPG